MSSVKPVAVWSAGTVGEGGISGEGETLSVGGGVGEGGGVGLPRSIMGLMMETTMHTAATIRAREITVVMILVGVGPLE